MNPAPGTVRTEAAENVGWVTISNPARHNALSIAMMRTLGEGLRHLDADPAIRVIVLRGDGTTAFAAGADISEFEGQQNSAEARRSADRIVSELFGTLEGLSTPLIAMIHGHCLGAGVAIALGADFRIAAEDARFAIPAARLGIGYPVALTHALVHAVGQGHAAEILFTGRTFMASEALAAGLVNRMLPASELQDAVTTLTAAIAANAPLSVRAAKAAIAAFADPTRQSTANALTEACTTSADAREGQRAFMEKRKPRFSGT